jgi:hypothetical protein
MFLYNVTLIVEESSNAAFLNWLESFYVPNAMSSGNFTSNRLLKVHNSPNEGTTYCLQFIAENMGNYEAYKQNFETKIEAELQSKFANKYVSFTTLMEYLD